MENWIPEGKRKDVISELKEEYKKQSYKREKKEAYF
jgi:hypothetical protein